MSNGAYVPAASAAPLPTDPAEIQRAIEVRQERLAATVDELTTRLSPKEVARRGTETAKVRAREAATTAQEKAREGAAVAQVQARHGVVVAQVQAREKAGLAQVKAREAVLAEDGSPRPERVAALGAGAVAVLALVVALLVRRRRR